ncbi:nickel/cobalt transporter [Aliarcobacter skirrowii]|uniref:nickel/cobalt transporter n=1 Tax=Aliarcobacter skirrowii TaxID=28200 RepID=UPI000D60E645|nr:DUF1007 family protein [Aliarcobacter skirrowii]PWE19753.1 DUF1007 domain-containing protein [Aliarcobacter skirrowii]PWE25764.1 DUF1007 domain-containing protein [Aliarcobacter skirrowii]RJO55398.1 DUF1007 family protein [Aliarcobacter skirrowii]RJO57353.1 DUF1007 family protein [Aliarcobacter skirrowii]
MIRIVFILAIIFPSYLLSCSLCAFMQPKTYVQTKVVVNEDKIDYVDIKWEFEKDFSEELLKVYDLNLDKSFNEKELKLIEDSLMPYLLEKSFLTTISYSNNNSKNSISFKVKDYKMSFENKSRILSFEYRVLLDLKLYDKNYFSIRAFDNEEFFFLILEDKNQSVASNYKFNKTTKIDRVTYLIEASNLQTQKFNIVEAIEESSKESLEDIWKKEQNKEFEKPQEEILNEQKKQSEEVLVLEEEKQKISFTDKFFASIKQNLVDIENGDKLALIFLLFASFLYGVVHSIGPGHGKALAFSYFSSQKSTYFEAFIISLLTAFIHILGAFIIVLISVFVLQSVLNKFLEDSVSYITSFSAVVIMILALYILYRKLTKKRCSCSACSGDLSKVRFSIVEENNLVKIKEIKPVHKRNKKQDLIFVLTAGIVPCPGTVLLFVYAFLLKTYFAVFLASISISLGMAVVIFASSFLGVSLHKISSKSQKLIDILEIIAPIFMFILAMFLFFASSSFKISL